MAASIYWQLLLAVKEKVAGLPGFKQPGFSTATFRLRKQPLYVKEQDGDIAVIISPREDLAERISEETFENGALLVFEVFVGICCLARWDEQILQWRLDRREEVRLAMWDPSLIQVQGLEIDDLQYEPNPPAPHGQGTRSESWQRFDILVSTTRFSA